MPLQSEKASATIRDGKAVSGDVLCYNLTVNYLRDFFACFLV